MSTSEWGSGNLFNTGTPDSGPLIVESITKLGFDPKDIKILINGHGHRDHAGAFAFFKKLTGAQVAIMEPDVAMVEDGGKRYRIGKAPTSYPGINADYRRTHYFLEMLKPDIFLGAHAEWFGYAVKRDRAKTAGVQAWVNPEEYRQFFASQKREFEDQVDLELGVKK